MRYDFRTMTTLPNPPWYVIMQDNNLVHDEWGLHLWCRNGEGVGVMLSDPHVEGVWRVRSRISAGATNPSTKVCELLWPGGAKDPITGKVPWPPELDFNESGDRTRSHQTFHYSDPPDAVLGDPGFNLMHHSAYPIDQTKWHTYGVEIRAGIITYSCDWLAVGSPVPMVNVPADQLWNCHIRAEPNGHSDVTHLDVRWMSYDP